MQIANPSFHSNFTAQMAGSKIIFFQIFMYFRVSIHFKQVEYSCSSAVRKFNKNTCVEEIYTAVSYVIEVGFTAL